MSDAPGESGRGDPETGPREGEGEREDTPRATLRGGDEAGDTEPVPPPPDAALLKSATILERSAESLERSATMLEQSTRRPPPAPRPPARLAVEEKPPPVPTRVANPIAVVALVVGIVSIATGALFVTAPLGAVLAVLALVLGGMGITRARKPGATGKGMAIGGIVTGILGLTAASAWLAIWISLNSAAGETGGLEQQIESEAASLGPTRSVFSLSVGDCFDHVVGDADQRVTLVPCSQPHRHEVFARLRVDFGPAVLYPGVNELRRTAGDSCKTEPFTSFVGSNYYSGSPLMVDTIFPSPIAWANGDREIVCVIGDPAGPVVGTLRDSGRRPGPTPRPLFRSPLPVYPVEPSPLPSP